MKKVIKVEDCRRKIEDYGIPIHNAMIIPLNATNGDMIKDLLNPRDDQIKVYGNWVEIEIQKQAINFNCELKWWNAPYKAESEE